MNKSGVQQILDQVGLSVVVVMNDFTIGFINAPAKELLIPKGKDPLKHKCHRHFFNSPDPCKRCPVKQLSLKVPETSGRFECMGGEFNIKARSIITDGKPASLLKLMPADPLEEKRSGNVLTGVLKEDPFLEELPLPAIITDSTTKILWANERWLTTFMFSSLGEVINREARIIYSMEEELDKLETKIKEDQAEHIRNDFLVFRTATQHNVLCSVHIARLANRKRPQWLWLFSRLPGDSEINEELRRREDYLRSIFRAAPVGIGVVIKRILHFVNPRITEITGYSARELLGKSARMLYLNEKEYKRVGDIKYKQIARKGTGSVETKWLCKDGSVKDILLSSTPIDTSNLLRGVTFTALDITDRKVAEKTASRFEETISNIQKGLASKVGERFFETMVIKMASILKADIAYVGEIQKGKKRAVETISFLMDGVICDNKVYELDDTPCDEALINGIRSYPDKVAELFPKDAYLKEEKIRGYIGISLFDSRGKIVGIMVALFRRPISEPRMTETIMNIFSARTGVEIERRQAVGELARANKLFRTIAENLPDIILRVDTRLKCIYVSPNAFDYAGIAPEDFIGKRLIQLDFELEFSRNREIEFRQVLKTKKSFETVISVNTEKGQRVLEWRMFPEFDHEGRVESILNLVRDLTQTRRTEKELNHLFNLSADMICITTSGGEFLKINPAWEKTLGYSEKELKEIPFFDLIHPDDLGKTYEMIADRLEKNEMVYSFENRYRCKDGSYRWLSWVIQPFGDEGLLFAIARDISEQKDMVNDLIQAKEMAEESDQLKSAFLANMSHEIRTPMNAIIGFASLLERDDINTEKRKHYVNIIRKRSEDLLSIISDILDISKIESGQLQINREAFSINELMNELYEDFLQKMADETLKNINLIIGKRADPNFDRLKSDRLRIKQVFINLLDNAIKFTDKGQISYGCVNQLDTIQFYVSDTGIGISRQKQEMVFERFRQGDDSTNRKFGGNGLGLSISRALVEMMGGSIWLDSIEGTGTTFYFTIPAAKTKKEKLINEIKRIGEGINLKGKRILIVEDDPLNREFLRIVLKKVGADIKFASNGKETLDLYENDPFFDLILMDVQLPDMDGFKVSGILREKNSKIPIIAQTAFTLSNDQVNAIYPGSTEYIQKPVKIDDLLMTIKKYL
jgi:PAS domain S-box-containing protein